MVRNVLKITVEMTLRSCASGTALEVLPLVLRVAVPWLMGCGTLADGAVYDVSGRCWLGERALPPPGESDLVSCKLITGFNHLSCMSFSRCKCWTSFRWKEGRRTPSKGSSPFCQVGEWAPAKTMLVLAWRELFPSLCVSVHVL